MTLNADAPEESRHELLFSIRRSVRYHNRRRMFFERLSRIITFLSLLGGSATVAAVLAKLGEPWILGFAILVAVSAAADLVIGTAKSARLHNDLARQFIVVEKQIVTASPFSQEILHHLTSQRLDIEQQEPPVLRVLDTLCHNELLRAMGYDRQHFKMVKWYQRWFAQFMDIREHAIH